MVASHRLFNCARCHRQVRICTYCDRGNIYCSDFCSSLVRIQSVRKAGARYQKTKIGRRHHAARQRRYRLRLLHKVTHHGPHNTSDGLRLILGTVFYFFHNHTVQKEVFFEKTNLDVHQTTKDGSTLCHFCRKPCGQFTRLGPLRIWRARSRQTRLPTACVGSA